MKRFLTSAPAFVEENFTDAYAVVSQVAAMVFGARISVVHS